MEESMESRLVEQKDLVMDEELDGWVNVEAQEEELDYLKRLDVHFDTHKINLVD